MKKKFFYILLGLIAINIYFLVIVIRQKPIKAGLKTVFFDVGQGDASLVMAEDGLNILIDGGPDKTVIEKLDKYLPLHNRKVDIMVLTHPHSDHVSGLVDVLGKYEVGEVWMTGVLHNSSEYFEFLGQIKDRKIKTKIIGSESGYELVNFKENTNIEILYPIKNLFEKKVDNLNNTSIVLKISYKDKSFLFTGDIEEEAEGDILKNYGDGLKADVLKTAHHGSITSNTENFLGAVYPEFAIISVGENNFGHPSLRVIKRLERMGML